MAVPVDPYPDFVPGTLADADKVDARIKALYDTLNPALGGIDTANVKDGTLTGADLAAGTITADKIAIALLQVFSVHRKVAMGVSGLVPAGSNLLVAHGLGVVPTVVVLTPTGTGLNAAAPNYDVQDATNFRIWNPQGFAYQCGWAAFA